MKKITTVGLAAVFAAGFASAQGGNLMVNQAPANDASEAEATVEAALVSSYVWRGQVLNNDFVFQPQFTISQYNVSFNIWANYDLGKSYNNVQGDLSEIDLSLAYTLPLNLNDVSFDVGAISYQFPGNGDSQAESTLELFAAAHVLTFQDYFIPSVTFFGDVKEVDGTYILFDFVAPYQVSDYLSVEAGFSAGWGNTRYNDVYFGSYPDGTTKSRDKGFNDFNFYGGASYEIMDNLTASINLTYTCLAGGQIENGAKEMYEAKEKLWGGVNVAYDF
jgi:hypothetical protein